MSLKKISLKEYTINVLNKFPSEYITEVYGTLANLKYQLDKAGIRYDEVIELIHEHRVIVTYSEYSKKNVEKCLEVLANNVSAMVSYDCQHEWFFKKLEF